MYKYFRYLKNDSIWINMVVAHKLAAAVAVDWMLALMVVEQIEAVVSEQIETEVVEQTGTVVVELEMFAVESFANHMFG